MRAGGLRGLLFLWLPVREITKGRTRVTHGQSARWDRGWTKIQVLPPPLCSCPAPKVLMVKLQGLCSQKGFQVKD